jgi:hypothetical protein
LIGEDTEKVEICCKVLPHPETVQSLDRITGHAKFCAECMDRKAFDQARKIIKTHTQSENLAHDRIKGQTRFGYSYFHTTLSTIIHQT